MSNHKTAKLVKKSTLRKFLEKGGYDVIEARDPRGWINPETGKAWWGIFKSLKEKTGLSKPTCMTVQRSFPTRKDAEDYLQIKPKIITIKDYTEGFWISKEDGQLLREAYHKSEEAEKLLRRVEKSVDRYILIDVVTFRTAKALVDPDLKFTEYVRKQIELSEKRESTLKNMLGDLERDLHGLWLNLHFLNGRIK
ncbi:MAG: hypothetical protein OEZ24_06630 [Candidatus Bathyarchaeota archaeon]|nr:hypothetical protein [Candidatus Bathyarchaeota archaeon]